MSTNINNMSNAGGGNDLGDPALGPHYARLVGFAFVGTQERRAYKGEAKPPCGKLLFTFELLDDFCEIDGVQKPRWISKIENAFNTPNANSVKIYGALDPTGVHNGAFDQLAINTTPCMVTIVQKTDAAGNPITGVKIGNIGPVANNPDGTPIPLPAVQNPVHVFDFDAPTLESYTALKPWMQKMVKEATNFAGSPCAAIAQQVDAQAATQGAAAAPAGQQQLPPAQQQLPPAGQQQLPPAQQQLPPAGQQQLPAQGAVNPGPAAAAPQGLPVAPPGFQYDAATNSFVPLAQATAGQGLPPAGGTAY